jgi:tetratricopeptide (TPR) repeat protein
LRLCQYESRDFNGAFKIYEGLPKEYRTNKSLLLQKLISAWEIGEKTSNPVMEEMQSLYPNDPCLKLCLINMYIQKKEWGKFLTSIDELEESVQDPYVSSLKVDVLMLLGRQTEAEDAIEHAIENIPEMVDLHWTRLGLMLASKQNAKIASYLTEIKKRFNVKINQISKTPDDAQFVASPEGKRWIAANEKN